MNFPACTNITLYIWNEVFLPAVSSTSWAGISSFFQTSCSFFWWKQFTYWTVGTHCLLHFWVVMLSQQPGIAFLCMSASNHTTDCFCLLLPSTASYFFLSLAATFSSVCISDCYCMLLLNTTDKWMLLSASPCFCLHLPSSTDACFCLLTPVFVCY
jgi:hypothetical protein